MRLVLIAVVLWLSAIAQAEVSVAYRSFSTSAAIGPPAEMFASKLSALSRATLGVSGEVRFAKLPGIPPLPAAFAGDAMAAVSAGASGGGFDAAYMSGSELNKAWGFIYNSGVPFGPTFDEFIGFLYGKSIENGQVRQTGLELVQDLLDARGRNVVAIPIVGSSEQLSGYFPEPIGDVHGRHGIGLAGLCQQHWVLRYLPPGENVLNQACDDLAASRKITKKNLGFIQSVPGGGSLVDAVAMGTLQGFEFATPLDDVSQLFGTSSNPGTVGVRYVHAPGWHQQFLITWMVVNKRTWARLSSAQQLLFQTVAKDNVLSSYGENVRQQGAALQMVLDANKRDGNQDNDMVLSQWPARDLVRLRDATIRFLNNRISDRTLSGDDRADYGKILEALRVYVRTNDLYWNLRQVDEHIRFVDWTNSLVESWSGVRL